MLLHHYNPIMAERFAKFPSDEWIAIAAKVGTPVQPIRSPEEALLDELLVQDGCVVEVDDPELGPVRQVGRVFQFHGVPNDKPAPPVAPGANTDDVKAEADAAADAPVARREHRGRTELAARWHPCARPRARGRGAVGHA